MVNSNGWAKNKLKELRKGNCEFCSVYSTKLQFAHLAPTPVLFKPDKRKKKHRIFRGRGRKERLCDFNKNRDRYLLVCSRACNDAVEKSGFTSRAALLKALEEGKKAC